MTVSTHSKILCSAQLTFSVQYYSKDDESSVSHYFGCSLRYYIVTSCHQSAQNQRHLEREQYWKRKWAVKIIQVSSQLEYV